MYVCLLVRTPVRYSNWSNLEPDDGNINSGQATHNEDCAVINPTMDWSDVPCWNRFRFICKFLPDNGRAISFGGTLSLSDVGNKQYDDFAQGLKTNKKPTQPTIGPSKPVIEGASKTREKDDRLMMKGYSGQGPARGGEKLLTSIMKTGKANDLAAGSSSNSAAMMKGKEAGVKGGAAGAAAKNPSAQGVSVMDAGRNGLKQITNALNKAAKDVGAASESVKNAGDAAMAPAKPGPGTTGLGAIPGATGAGINGNPGLGKIGGVEALGGASGSVQKGGNGGQSAISMKAGSNAGMTSQASSSANSAAGAGGASSGGMSSGANGGAAGHVAGNGGLAQTQKVQAGVSGGSSGAATGNGGALAGGAGAAAGGAGAANAGGMGLGGGNAGGAGAVTSGQRLQRPSSSAGMGGGGQQLTLEQAAAAKQLANQIAPQLAKAYSKKFEPDMQMIQALCGRFCAKTVVAFPDGNPQQLGEACGRLCAESLLKGSPQDVMNMMAKLSNGSPAPAVSNSAVGTMGGHMQKGDNQPVGGISGGGGSNVANGGGSNGGGQSGGSAIGSSGGSSGSHSSASSGWSFSTSNSGGAVNSDSKGINLHTLGSIIAPILGLSVEGASKISVEGGQTLNTKVNEAIDTLKEQYNLKTKAASKSSTPGRVTETSTEQKEAKGYYLLKKMDGNKDTVQNSKSAKKYSLSISENKTEDASSKDKKEAPSSKGHVKSEGPSSMGHVTGSKRHMKFLSNKSLSKAKKGRKRGKHRKKSDKKSLKKHKGKSTLIVLM